MKPAWLNKLNDEQINYAAQIADKAREMGVPEALAVALAYHESGLNPARVGAAKEIGLMQVLPSTGEMLGYKPEDLQDPAKNIEAGLKYLKQQLDTFQAPELAALAYNRGPGVAEKFIAGEEDTAGQKYVKSVQSLGGFSGAPREAPEEAPVIKPTAEETAADANRQAQEMAGLVGGGFGALLGAKRYVGEKAGKAAQFLGKQAELGRMAAQQAGAAGGLPGAGGLGGPTPSAAQPGPATGRGSAVVNYARAFGLPEIEAQRALDMTKQEGGVHALTTQRREGLGEIAKRFPGERYIENPRFGGLMTPDYGPAGPPQTFTQQPGGGMTSVPKPAPIPTAPIKPAGLEQVAQTFRAMMGPAARTLGRVAGPLGLLSTGTESVAAAQELARPEPNYPAALASGVGALGGVLSAILATAPVGVPLSIAGPLMREQIKGMEARRIPPKQLEQMTKGPQMDMANMIRAYGR